jgi:hypothetical protein
MSSSALAHVRNTLPSVRVAGTVMAATKRIPGRGQLLNARALRSSRPRSRSTRVTVPKGFLLFS